jgi:RNA 3'-terminal phosphate cyclase (ATP)
VRTALTLSALSHISLRIHHIRAKRKNPGLRPQHLIALRALATAAQAEAEGAEIGSSEILFRPGPITAGKFHFDMGTAGATGLVLQAMIPALLFGKAPSRIRITGGTHVPWSPSFHYLEAVFLPVLEAVGADVSLDIGRWGWYPRGGGTVEAIIGNTGRLKAIHLTNRGAITELHILSAVSNLPLSIAER